MLQKDLIFKQSVQIKLSPWNIPKLQKPPFTSTAQKYTYYWSRCKNNVYYILWRQRYLKLPIISCFWHKNMYSVFNLVCFQQYYCWIGSCMYVIRSRISNTSVKIKLKLNGRESGKSNQCFLSYLKTGEK